MDPRKQLGQALKRRRKHSGMSGEQLAHSLGTTQSKVSRTENGVFRPDLDVVRRWLEITATGPAEAEQILKLADDAATEIAEYRDIFRGSLANSQRALISQDANARRILHFQPFQIPGPMQTEAYARNALLASRMDETGLEEAVEARLLRGTKLMESGSPAYHVIITEPALYYRPMGVTKPDQINAWRKVVLFCQAPGVTVQVIPTDAEFRQAPMCAFVMTYFRDPVDQTIVQVELPAIELTFGTEADIERFEQTWSSMIESALDPKRSKQFLHQLANS